MKILASVSTFHLGRTSAGKFTRDSIQNLIMRLRRYRPNQYLSRVLTHTRFDGIVVDGKAKLVLDEASSAFEINETSFLEDIDGFFQKKRFTRMRMFEVRTPAENPQEADRVDLVIVAGENNYRMVDRHMPLQGRPD